MKISAKGLEPMLAREQPLPEEQIRAAKDPSAIRESPSAQMVLAEAAKYVEELDEIGFSTSAFGTHDSNEFLFILVLPILDTG